MNETLFTNTKEPGRFIQLLCVDDEHLILEILTDFFNVAYKKVKVYTSNQNKEALELASRYCPDLILTDINRPGGNGYDFLNLLRDNPRTKHIPVFSISGSVSPGIDKKFKQS